MPDKDINDLLLVSKSKVKDCGFKLSFVLEVYLFAVF